MGRLATLAGLSFVALMGPACVDILGDYAIASQRVGAPCTDDTQLEDCGPYGACYVALCFASCSDSSACGDKSACISDVCVGEVGTDCSEDSLVCGPGICTDRDANGLGVDPYCTFSCISRECPSGFVCDGTECRRL